MFTGLITAVGSLDAIAPRNGGLDLTIGAPWTDLELGESIAINGTCLTVAACGAGTFQVHLVAPSRARTAFDDRAVGDRLNLERALRLGDRLGGHLVQGHVDGVGEVLAATDVEDARLIDIRLPEDVAAVTILRGSITIDGVSLTVQALPGPRQIRVAVIPFTLQATTLGERVPGDRVHLEGDMVGKYIQALVARPAESS